jgi:hypothetical protein
MPNRHKNAFKKITNESKEFRSAELKMLIDYYKT